MACRLPAPSHYLNQYLFSLMWSFGIHLLTVSPVLLKISMMFLINVFENDTLKRAIELMYVSQNPCSSMISLNKKRHDANFYVIGPRVVTTTSGASSDNKAVTNTTIGLSHFNDVIMSAMASQITSLTIVYSTVYSGVDQRKHQSSASLAFVPVIGEFPAQMASNAENVSIWWRHHVMLAGTLRYSSHNCINKVTAAGLAPMILSWAISKYNVD